MSLADELLQNASTRAGLLRGVLPIRPDNLVRRPWGGSRLPAFKGLRPPLPGAPGPWGESFELAAHRDDPEAKAYPSVVVLPDSSEVELPALLDVAAEEVLGRALAAAHDGQVPLLPKFLDVRELLSVQTHPPGRPEVYVVVDAEPGATMRVGFRQEVDAEGLVRRLTSARGAQEALLEHLRPGADAGDLQRSLAPALARRRSGAEALLDVVAPHLAVGRDDDQVLALLATLQEAYEHVLDLLNALPVEPGTVVFNATPHSRHTAEPSAEVHALGNPEGLEVLLLEVRLPAPSLRLWDHARFPVRPLSIAEACRVSSLAATTPADFLVEPQAVEGRAGRLRAVDSALFGIDLLRPEADAPVALGVGGAFRSLHVTRGDVEVRTDDDATCVRLRRGTSALVPVGFAGGEVQSVTPNAEVVEVTLPLPGAAR